MKKIIPFLLLLAGYGLQAQTPGEETGKIRIYETEDATAGQCDGTITVEAEGSAGPFWLRVSGPNDFGVIVDDFEGESIVEGLCPGDYTILVTNAYDCEVVLEASVSCTLTFEVEIEHACRPGGGRIRLTPAAAAAPVAYQWTGPDDFTATTAEISGLVAGTYSVSAVDANGCTAEGSYTVSPEEMEIAWPYIRQLTVFAARGGELTRIYDGQWVTTGPGCLRYAGGSIDIAEDLYQAMLAGEVEWRFEVEANRPLASLSLSALALPALELVPIQEDRVWIAFMPAAAVASAIGPDGFYFSLTLAGEDADGNALIDFRTITPELADCVQVPFLQNDCTWSATVPSGIDRVHILESKCLQVNLAPDPIRGRITAQVTGGGVYSYQWYDENGNTLGRESDQKVDASGRYCVRIVDKVQNCLAEECIDFCLPDQLEPKQFLSITPPCGDGGDGRICLTEEAGSWVIRGPDGGYYTCLESLRAGNHLVQLVNLSCDGVEELVGISVPEQGSGPMIELASSSPACPGGSNGRICISISGGSAPYSVQWENGQTSLCADQLAAGRCHSVTVTDRCGVQTVACLELPSYTLPEVERIVVNNDCGKGVTSSATAYVRGGKEEYIYEWININGPTYQSGNINYQAPIAVGAYYAKVTDGCSNFVYSDLFVVEESPNANFEILPERVADACAERDPSGLIDLSMNPKGIYQYEWNTGATTEDLVDVAPGAYYVTVIEGANGEGCSRLRRFDIGVRPLTFEVLSSYNTLKVVNVTGEAPFQYLWKDADGNIVGREAVLEGASNGEYCVTVGDARKCLEERCVDFCGDYLPTLSTLVRYPCNPDDPSGSLEIDAVALETLGYEVEDFTFIWSTGEQGPAIESLLSGNYALTITYGCNRTVYTYGLPHLEEASLETTGACGLREEPYTIAAQPPEVLFNTSFTSYNHWTKKALAYLWNTGETERVIFPKESGEYFVTITDGSCSVVRSIYFDAAHPTVTVTDWRGPAPGLTDGYIEVEVSGGEPPYTYHWSYDAFFSNYRNPNFSTDQNIYDLRQGKYNLVVEGANGCRTQRYVPMGTCAHGDWEIELTGKTPLLFRQGGAIELEILNIRDLNRYSDFRYAWTGPDGEGIPHDGAGNLTGVKKEGAYTVRVTDSCGRSKTLSYYLSSCEVHNRIYGENDHRMFTAENRCLGGWPYGIGREKGRIKIWDYQTAVLERISATPSDTHRKFKIIWPDEDVTECDCMIEKDEFGRITDVRCDFQGPMDFEIKRRSDYNIHDGETFCVTVVDGSGCSWAECFSFSRRSNVLLSLTNDSVFDFIPTYGGNHNYPIVGVKPCEVCGVSTSPNFNESNCDEDLSGLQYFEQDANYEAVNTLNPCKGGGTILIGENSINPIRIEIAANPNNYQYIDYEKGSRMIGSPENPICEFDAYCLVDPFTTDIKATVEGGIQEAILIKVKVREACGSPQIEQDCVPRLEAGSVDTEICTATYITCDGSTEVRVEDVSLGSDVCDLPVAVNSDVCNSVVYCPVTGLPIEVVFENIKCEERFPLCGEIRVVNGPDGLIADNELRLPSDSTVMRLSPIMPIPLSEINKNTVALAAPTAAYRPFPNPFQDAVEVAVQSEEKRQVVIRISNVLGREIFRQTVHLEAGYSRLRLEIPAVHPDGLYVLQLSSEKERYSWMLVRSRRYGAVERP